MEFDLATAKLVSLFTLTNLIASSIGFLTASATEPLIGLAVMALMLFMLPIPVQYFFLKKEGVSTSNGK